MLSQDIILRLIMWLPQIAAFVFAIVMWPKYKNTTQRNFIYFLGFVLIIECLGYLLPIICDVKSAYVYNCYTIISGLFLLIWFKSILQTKRLVIVFISVFIVSIGYCLFFQEFGVLWKIPLVVLAIAILICSTVFFSDLLAKNEVVNFKTDQKFWIVTGCLVFYIGYLPLVLLQKYFGLSGIYYRIPITINISLMYGFIIKSFLCLKKN
ncbi:hypothetical protein V6251_04835 [Olleya sp. Ti.3.14]|uniref:hypothetical protein n=1 Tax=Olleya sp. Ti.3.14 TaxID=3121297 RepID=UPI00311F3EB5